MSSCSWQLEKVVAQREVSLPWLLQCQAGHWMSVTESCECVPSWMLWLHDALTIAMVFCHLNSSLSILALRKKVEERTKTVKGPVIL